MRDDESSLMAPTRSSIAGEEQPWSPTVPTLWDVTPTHTRTSMHRIYCMTSTPPESSRDRGRRWRRLVLNGESYICHENSQLMMTRPTPSVGCLGAGGNRVTWLRFYIIRRSFVQSPRVARSQHAAVLVTYLPCSMTPTGLTMFPTSLPAFQIRHTATH